MEMKFSDGVPALTHDQMMLDRFSHRVPAHGRVERRVVWGLFAHLAQSSWSALAVYDGEGETLCAGLNEQAAKAAMELIFNLDECAVHVHNANGAIRTFRLTLGNGLGIVSDWTYTRGDVDGFNACMQAFIQQDNLERFA